MLRTIGLMSGTSLDGVDAAWLETDGERIGRLGPSLTLPYDDALRADLRRLLDLAPSLAADDPSCRRHRRAADRRHVEAVARARRARRPDRLPRPDHPAPARPPPDLADRRRRALARETGLPRRRTISARPTSRRAARARRWRRCFTRPCRRAAEPAGGAEPRRRRATSPGSAPTAALLAFDTGPGNGPLDDWARRHTGSAFDRDGLLARCGTGGRGGARAAAGPPVFRPPAAEIAGPAGSFGRSLAASGMEALSPADGAATLVAFTAARGRRGRAARRRRDAGWLPAAAGTTLASWRACGPPGGAGRSGRSGRLGRRRAGGAVLRLSRRAQLAGLPLSFPGHDRRAAPDDGRAARRARD